MKCCLCWRDYVTYFKHKIVNSRLLYEIKFIATFYREFTKNIDYFRENNDECTVIYQGKEDFMFKNTAIKPTESFFRVACE